MSTVAQNAQLINNLLLLIEAHRPIFNQERVYGRAMALIFGEIFSFSRRTITQLLMTLGLTEEDWSGWYRLFSAGRFRYEAASAVLFAETLTHIGSEAVYVVGGDSTQTPRSSRKMEGSGWLRNMRTPPFKVGIHAAQRWFNGSWLIPTENGYSRAVPMRWLPAFTAKSQPTAHAPCKEWEAALHFLGWVRQQLTRCGRSAQQVLGVFDGSYDVVAFWRGLPENTVVMVRSGLDPIWWVFRTLCETGSVDDLQA